MVESVDRPTAIAVRGGIAGLAGRQRTHESTCNAGMVTRYSRRVLRLLG
jgi:hypothetical protein